MYEDIKKIEDSFIKEQQELFKRIDFANRVVLPDVNTVAGADIAYWNKDGKEYAVCCIVVIDYRTHKVIEEASYTASINVPYIPGCLAYREIPVFMETYQKIGNVPDVIFFDGNGYLHPRHMGLAVHAGILLGKITVGIAKTYYKIRNVDFEMTENIAGAYSDIVINGEVYGRALRTHAGVKPVFVSTGNKISLDMAVHMANELTGKESHIPIPTRLADLMTHKERKKYNALD